MASDSVALVISALALIISFVALYLSRLRGPSIKPIELEESKRTVLIDNSQRPDVDRLPFTVAVSVVNSGGTAGIVANPNASITPVDSLKQEPAQIVIQQTSIEPSTSTPEQAYGLPSARTYSIPPYPVSVIILRCHLALMEFERIPPIHRFTKGCDLKQVHLAHFNSNKERMRMLISKLQLANTLGQLKVTIDCTEKIFPVFGPMKYKSKEFLSNAPIAYDVSLVKQLNENYEGDTTTKNRNYGTIRGFYRANRCDLPREALKITDKASIIVKEENPILMILKDIKKVITWP